MTRRSRPRRSTTRRVQAAGLAATALLAACNITSVTATNDRVAGESRADLVARELGEFEWARGSMKIENGTATIPRYGYLGDGPMLPAPGDLPSATHKVEATKTEPDKNVYLVLPNQTGADPSYDYGTHFLYQGHEGGAGYVTRVNLDADTTHRVTLISDRDTADAALPTFDGIVWNPWAQNLLLSAEKGNAGGIWQTSPAPGSKARDISGVVGRGGYEGMQFDNLGNLWFIEDVGGVKGTTNTSSKQPNSFVYRLLPTDPSDLTAGGKVQALQITSKATGQPITFHAGQADADILSQDVSDLHAYGNSFKTKWVTIHDTAVDGSTPFDANALAKARSATPLKRPENGVFRPGKGFTDFYFTETGDTTTATEAGAQYGGFGAVFHLRQLSPASITGTLTMVYRGDAAHTGFDNISFGTHDLVFVAEDASDTVHGQRNAFDSLYQLDVTATYGRSDSPAPVRAIALGRDPSATVDAGFSGMTGFQNDGDNEVTGVHVSDGDPTPDGLFGVEDPDPPKAGFRMFFTRQHGDNVTYELFFIK